MSCSIVELRLEKVNGKKIRNLRQLKQEVEKVRNGFLKFEVSIGIRIYLLWCVECVHIILNSAVY